MKMKGNTVTKKTVACLAGVIVLAFVAVAVYATADTGQTLTNDTSIASAEGTKTEGSAQICVKDCQSCEGCDGDCENCEGCDGNCEDCEKCEAACKGHGEGRMCGGHGDSGNGCWSGGCGGHGGSI